MKPTYRTWRRLRRHRPFGRFIYTAPTVGGLPALRETVGLSDRATFNLQALLGGTLEERVGLTDRLTFVLDESFLPTLGERIGLTDRVTAALVETIQYTLREEIGLVDRAFAAVGQAYGPRMVILTHIYFDEGRENYSSHTVTSDHAHEGKVITFGSIEREIEVPTGPARLADISVEYTDTDQYWREKFGNKTPRMRKADFLIGPVPGSEALYQRVGKMTVQHATFPPGRMRLHGTDQRFKWLDKPLPNHINSRNFENLPAGVTDAFFPIVFGRNFTGGEAAPLELGLQGAVECIHVDTVLHRYTLAHHPILGARVFTMTPDQTSFESAPYTWTMVSEIQFIDGHRYDPTYAQFSSALPEGTRVRADIDGVSYRGPWGTLPEVGFTRNLVDHLINILYYIKRMDEGAEPDFSDYDHHSFAVVRDKFDALGYLADYMITEPLTGWEVLTQMLSSFVVHMFPDSNDRIKLALITDEDFDDAPEIDDYSGILLKSEEISLANPTKNRYRYRYARIPADDQWGAEETFDNTPDQEALGEVEELQVDLHAVRVPDVASEVIAERSRWEDQDAHRIHFQLDAVTNLTNIDLMKPIRLSHYGGLAEGGWTSETFLPYRVRLDLDHLLYDIDAIRRPLLANPLPQLGALGIYRWNARVGPEYVSALRRLFVWFVDSRAPALQKMVVMSTNALGQLEILDDGVYPAVGYDIGSFDGVWYGNYLHIATQQVISGRVAYSRFNGNTRTWDILNAEVLTSNSDGDVGVTLDVQDPSGKVTIMFQGDREFSSGFPAGGGAPGWYQRAWVSVRNDDGSWTTPVDAGDPEDAYANLWFPIWGDPDYNGAVHVNVGRAIRGQNNRIHFIFSRTEPGDVASTNDFLIQTLRVDGTLSQTFEWKMTGGGEYSSQFLGGQPTSFEDEDGQFWIAMPVSELFRPRVVLWKDVDNPTVPDNEVYLSTTQVQPDTFGPFWAPLAVKIHDGVMYAVHGTRAAGTEEWAALKTIDLTDTENAVASPSYTANPRDQQLGPRWPESTYARHGFDIKTLRDGHTYIFKTTSGNFGVPGTGAPWILEVYDLDEDVPADPSFTLADWIVENS